MRLLCLNSQITYMMVVAIVATSIAEELRDIALCALAVRGKGKRKWRCWCWLLQTYRRFCFVPTLLTLVLTLVMSQGSSALEICFSALAILFLLQVDNQFYQFALSERVRAEVEEFGRVELDAEALTVLATSKTWNIMLIIFFAPFLLYVCGTGIVKNFFVIMITPVFWGAYICEGVSHPGAPRERVWRAAEAFGIGFFGWLTTFNITMGIPMPIGLAQVAICFTIVFAIHLYDTIVVPIRATKQQSPNDLGVGIFSVAMASLLPTMAWTLLITYPLWEHIHSPDNLQRHRGSDMSTTDWHTKAPFAREYD